MRSENGRGWRRATPAEAEALSRHRGDRRWQLPTPANDDSGPVGPRTAAASSSGPAGPRQQRGSLEGKKLVLVSFGAQDWGAREQDRYLSINSDRLLDLRGMEDPGRNRRLVEHIGVHPMILERLLMHEMFADVVNSAAEVIVSLLGAHGAPRADNELTFAICCRGGRHRSVGAIYLICEATRMVIPGLLVVYRHMGSWRHTCEGQCDVCRDEGGRAQHVQEAARRLRNKLEAIGGPNMAPFLSNQPSGPAGPRDT